MSPTDELAEYGRVWFRGFLSTADIKTIAGLTTAEDRPGSRLPLTSDLARFVSSESRLAEVVTPFGVDGTPVRLVSFDKTVSTNWAVPWHQDRVVAVKRRSAVKGYGNWVRKAGFWHCEPPAALLDKMVFVRVHIDDTPDESGPMVLALKSHRYGVVSAQEARAVATRCELEVGKANAGDVLVVHALTLHQSSSATVPTARRALRLDYAPRAELADGLDWAIPA